MFTYCTKKLERKTIQIELLSFIQNKKNHDSCFLVFTVCLLQNLTDSKKSQWNKPQSWCLHTSEIATTVYSHFSNERRHGGQPWPQTSADWVTQAQALLCEIVVLLVFATPSEYWCCFPVQNKTSQRLQGNRGNTFSTQILLFFFFF